jgi:Zn/Cd-binding protein ZinT
VEGFHPLYKNVTGEAGVATGKFVWSVGRQDRAKKKTYGDKRVMGGNCQVIHPLLLQGTFDQVLQAGETERKRSKMKRFCMEKLPIFDNIQIVRRA